MTPIVQPRLGVANRVLLDIGFYLDHPTRKTARYSLEQLQRSLLMDVDNNPAVTPPSKGPPPATTNLKVTPYKNGGTSSHSEFREGSLRAHLAPSLLVDLKKHQNVSVDQFLNGLLGFVREKEEISEPQQSAPSSSNSPETSLPDLILEVGVEVANLFCQVAGRTPSTAAASQNPSSTGKGYGYGLLQDFCQAGTETNRYPIFCKIVNSILARTKTKDLKGFLKSNDLDILLQNTSLFEVKIYHQGQESTRKPDCTFLPSAIARMYYDPAVLGGPATRANSTNLDDKQQLWNAIVDKVAGKSLDTRIMYMEWDMHHGVVEKKTGHGIKNHPVPTSYEGSQLADDQKHTGILDTIQVRFDPSNSMHPSRTSQPLEQNTVESGSKRKSQQQHEDAGEDVDVDAHRAKRVNTGAATADGKKPGDASKAHKEKPAEIAGDASKVHDKQPETIPEVQFAGYNAEMLCSPKIIRQHTIGMLNEDKYVHLWWFDHQGPVRSSPLNFIDDLPRFVVFLWILQRLTREGWGYVPIMDTAPDVEAEKRLTAREEGAEVEQDANAEEKANVDEKAKAKQPPPAPVELKCRGETYFAHDAYVRKHHIWGLNGRKTCVREMKRCSNPTATVAVKVAWQEASRTSEKQIFDRINSVAKEDPTIKEHIPELILEETVTEYSTGRFRRQAGISPGPRGTGYRVLRITVYSMLDGCITDLKDDDFWRVLLQCFDCHYKLWLSGVHHRDISAFNLMYKRLPDGKIIGVLIDFDLAIISGAQSLNTERTGTMPFMALDVLDGITTGAPQQHLYRYDVESFLWVAIWVCGTFEHGKERKDPPFKAWTQGDAEHCRAYKLNFLSGISEPWSGDFQAKDEILQNIRERLRDDHNLGVKRASKAMRDRKAGREVEPEVPASPNTIYEGINWDLLSGLREKLGEPGMKFD